MDKTPKAFVMAGNLNDGYVPIGPFENWEAASAWADKHIAEEMTWIMTLYSPEDYFEMLEMSTK